MNSAASQGGCQFVGEVLVGIDRFIRFLKPCRQTVMHLMLSITPCRSPLSRIRPPIRVSVFRRNYVRNVISPAAVKYDPTWRSAVRTKGFEALVLSYLNKRESSNQRLTCMVNKLMQFRQKSAPRIEVRTRDLLLPTRLLDCLFFAAKPDPEKQNFDRSVKNVEN